MPIPASGERLYRGARTRRDFWTNRKSAVVQWYFTYDEEEDAEEYFAGDFETIGSVWGGSITRRVPRAHPTRPDIVALGCDTEYIGNSGTSSMYSGILMHVEYGIPPYATGGDTPFASIRRDVATRYITIPGRRAYFSSDGTRLNQDIALPFPVVNIEVTLYGLAVTNHAAVATAAASPVNSSTFYLPDGSTAAAGYALFLGVSDQQTYTVFGQSTMAVSYRFSLTSGISWLQLVHPLTGAIEAILRPGGGAILGSSNLNALFL
jgi:hypothetical protein